MREQFRLCVNEGRFPAGLRVKGVRGARGVFETTWAPDGRFPGAGVPDSSMSRWAAGYRETADALGL